MGYISYKDVDKYLKVEECRDGYLYLISARNAHLGICQNKGVQFLLRRDKFGWILWPEEHWDTDEQHGTVKPIQELEKVPNYLFENNLSGKINNVFKEHMMEYLKEMDNKYPVENFNIPKQLPKWSKLTFISKKDSK